MADDQNAAAAGVNYGEGLRLPETSSRCVTEWAAHNFELTDYSLVDGLGAGKFVRSSTFRVGGYHWSIRFYPGGTLNPATTSHASAFLVYLGATEETIMAQFTLTMLDKAGKVVASKEGLLETYIFSPQRYSWGSFEFVEKQKLKHHDAAGCFTIRCVLKVIKEPPEDQCKEKLFGIPPPELPGQLARALEGGKDADVTLLVGGREFRAHRFMLAERSLVFRAQLLGRPMAERKDTPCVIEVVDMEPAIFEMLLHFIYTDSLPPCDGEEGYGAAEMQHLLVAADRYGLGRLKAMCEVKLCGSIDVKTFMSTLALANQHSCERLKNACHEFMSKPGRVRDVLSSDGFRRLMASCTPLLLDDKSAPKKNLKLSSIN